MEKITVNKMQAALDKKEHEGKLVAFGLVDDLVFDTELSLDETSTFIQRVVQTVVNEDGYFPERLEVMFFVTCLQMMSNANVPTKNAALGKDSETVKVLDMKKVWEWYQAARAEWLVFYANNWNLYALHQMVEKKIEWALKEAEKDTAMQRFFQKISDTLDHLDGEHGMGVAELWKAFTPQVSGKAAEDEVVTVQYADDGTMMV